MGTNYVKAKKNYTQQNSKWGLSGEREETINFIDRKGSKIAQKKYKNSYGWVRTWIYWNLCKRLNFNYITKWYLRKPEFVQKKWYA